MERALYSASKELALQALGPEFSPQNPRKEVKCGAICLEAHAGEVDTRGAWGLAGQPA